MNERTIDEISKNIASQLTARRNEDLRRALREGCDVCGAPVARVYETPPRYVPTEDPSVVRFEQTVRYRCGAHAWDPQKDGPL